MQRYTTDTSHQMNPLDVWRREETAENQQPDKQVYTNQKYFTEIWYLTCNSSNSVCANLISIALWLLKSLVLTKTNFELTFAASRTEYKSLYFNWRNENLCLSCSELLKKITCWSLNVHALKYTTVTFVTSCHTCFLEPAP